MRVERKTYVDSRESLGAAIVDDNGQEIAAMRVTLERQSALASHYRVASRRAAFKVMDDKLEFEGSVDDAYVPNGRPAQPDGWASGRQEVGDDPPAWQALGLAGPQAHYAIEYALRDPQSILDVRARELATRWVVLFGTNVAILVAVLAIVRLA